MTDQPAPLSRRPIDIVFIVFWAINFFFITYMIDIEQIVIADPSRFSYPIWPPRFAVDAIHWWSRSFDPVVWGRAPWYRASIWIDSLIFGPFYAFAMLAFWKGKRWIRIPCFVWAGMMISIVTIILFEEFWGSMPTASPGLVFAANLPWLLFPFGVIARMVPEDPFAS